MEHPATLNTTSHLVAIDKAGNALYGERNFRSGGRRFILRTPEGKTRSWDTWGIGKNRPKPAPAGRWKWNDLKELYA